MKLGAVVIFTFVLFTGIIRYTEAQTYVIDTDRPDQSDGVSTIPFKSFQIEEGILFANSMVSNNLMVRYGISKSTEIRLETEFGKVQDIFGFYPLSLSLKQRLLPQNRLLPAITVVGYLSLGPVASKNFKTNAYPFELKLAFENQLPNNFLIAYNVGSSDRFKKIDLTFHVGYEPSTKIYTFIEYFSDYSQSQNNQNIDLGILYSISPVLQIDIAVGRSIFSKTSHYFGTLGISYFISN